MYENFAEYWLSVGSKERALAAWQSAFDHRRTVRYSHNVSVLAAETGDRKRGFDMAKVSLEIDPGFIPARVNVASHLAAVKKFNELVTVCREGLVQVPDHPELNFFLAMALFELREYDEARSLLEYCMTLPLPAGAKQDVMKALRLVDQYEGTD